MAENPALKPAEEAVDGDNLTPKQAALCLACLEYDANNSLEEAEELGMTEEDVDDLISLLSEMAGEDAEAEEGEESEGEDEEEEEVAE